MGDKARLLIRPWIFTVVLCLAIFLSPGWTPEALAKKDYSILNVVIEARLNSDGSMDIKEKRTYGFRGHFRWATYVLPKIGTGGISDFSVSEEDNAFVRSNEETPGAYQYQETPEAVSVKWFFRAANENRTFILSYRILGVVRRYQDVAVLYHRFVGTGWTKPTGQVEVFVYPPEPAGSGEVKAWAHGPHWGKIRTEDDGTLVAKISSLPEETSWEVRAIYPTRMFENVEKVIDRPVAAEIVAQEQKWMEEVELAKMRQKEAAEARAIEREQARLRKDAEWWRVQELTRARKEYGRWIVGAIAIIVLLSIIRLWLTYGRKHEVPFTDDQYSFLPSNITPAFLGHLLRRGQTDGSALVGTLLDLARRGFLKIREEVETRRGIFRSSEKHFYCLELDREFYSDNKDHLQSFEQELLVFLFENLAEGKDAIDFRTLKKRKVRFAAWFRNWAKEVTKLAESQGYWEEDSLKAKSGAKTAGAILLAVAFFAAILIEEWAIILGLAAILLLMVSARLPRRIPKFELEAKRWIAFSRFLKECHFAESGTRYVLENIGKFLIYGVVLGFTKGAIKKMTKMIPEGECRRLIPWYVATHPHIHLSSFALGTALSSLMTNATSTMRSAAAMRVSTSGAWRGASSGGGARGGSGTTGGSGGGAG